jgi:autotransporter-associated beta strand protein
VKLPPIAKAGRRLAFKIEILFALSSGLWLATADAESGMWLANPVDNNFNNPANWSSGRVPRGGETATFGTSSITSLVVPLYTFVGTIAFLPGASAYTITFTLVGESNFFFWFIDGAGIDNQSGIAQNFVLPAPVNDFGNGAVVDFYDGDAGDLTNFTCEANTVTTGTPTTVGFGGAGCGSATFRNLGASNAGGFGGVTAFSGLRASAETATIINEGGTTVGAQGGQTVFESYEGGFSSAGDSTIIAKGGTNGGDGGSVTFYHGCSGGRARFELFGNGYLDVSPSGQIFKTGSIEGDGRVYLGIGNLSLGANNLSTTFSGTLHAGAPDGRHGTGALTKIGSGTTTLTGANLYEGGTTVTAGTLLVNNHAGSGTGTGTVSVTGGTFGGNGTVSGDVIVGTGNGGGAIFAPAAGSDFPAIFTTEKTVTFQADSAYNCLVRGNGRSALSDQAAAAGVTINSGALFNLTGQLRGPIHPGTTFTVISNTASTPISGAFANLADGATITLGSISLNANYEGGDGNDLTLTVQ